MYLCYLCDVCPCSISDLIIYCRQEKCKSSFSALYNFIRHLNSYHQTITDLVSEHVESAVLSEGQHSFNCFPDNSSVCINVIPSVNTSDCLKDVRSKAVSLVARLRANSSIPYGVIPDIVQSYNNMAGSITTYMHAEFRSSMLTAGINPAIIDQVSQDMDNKLQACRNPLHFLSTRYQIDSYFAGHPLIVAPEPVYYVPRLESHGGSSTFMYDQFQYVSVKKTLFTSLQNKCYVEAWIAWVC